RRERAMMQSSIDCWTRNLARGTIHPHRERWGLLYPLTPRVKIYQIIMLNILGNYSALIFAVEIRYDFFTEKLKSTAIFGSLECIS
ncbi:MAG: hypothetical protein M0Q43_04350, partial [Methanothrix sp.]|nr:hypothetical protein [Methanothrix sp.]